MISIMILVKKTTDGNELCLHESIFLVSQFLSVNGAETNCRIAHILGILLMNSCNTDIFFSNYHDLKSVRFELILYNFPCRTNFDVLSFEDIAACMIGS